MTINIVVFISGNGTNLQKVIDEISLGNLNYNINLVVSNKKKAFGLIRAKNHGIPTLYLPYIKKNYKSRDHYDKQLGVEVIKASGDFKYIVCLGWMHILSLHFLNQFKPNTVLNLHPALPGKFPGKDAITLAYNYYKKYPDSNAETGAMVHWVVPEIDAGETISLIKIPIDFDDTIDILRKRVQTMEKLVLINALKKLTILD